MVGFGGERATCFPPRTINGFGLKRFNFNYELNKWLETKIQFCESRWSILRLRVGGFAKYILLNRFNGRTGSGGILNKLAIFARGTLLVIFNRPFNLMSVSISSISAPVQLNDQFKIPKLSQMITVLGKCVFTRPKNFILIK